jgi:DNA polymerase-1
MKNFLIIDGNAYIHRAYHALPPLSASNDRQVNAIYGFVKFLLKIKNNFNPDYMIVCFDYLSKNFRHEIFKDYKANRKPLDEALISQMPIAREAVKALNIAKIEIKGYEADDLIATLTRSNKENGVRTVIVADDKDILQLAEDENVFIWNYSKDIMYDARKVEEKYGVMPKQLSDVFALMGDASDNIPGIKGIGEKTAVKLIEKFGNLENVLQNADSVKGNMGKLLSRGKEQALLSRKLIELNKWVPLDYKLEEFENKDIDADKAVPFFEKYEFKSLLSKYSAKEHELQFSLILDETHRDKKSRAGSFMADKSVFEIVNVQERAAKVAEKIEQAGIFALKTVSSTLDSLKTQIVGISLCVENKTFYFPIGHNDLAVRQITFADFKNIFAPLFSSDKIKKIGHDLKQERNIYSMYGVRLNNIYFDIMLASYCLNPAKSHSITDMSKGYLDFTAGGGSYSWKGAKKSSFADSSIEAAAKYANSISGAVFAIYKIFDFKIKEKKLSLLFFGTEMPLVEVLSEMEISGIKVDLPFLRNFNEKIVYELKKIENKIYKIADGEFNINSQKQLSFVMFGKLNLPVIKKTKTGYSTDEEVLVELSFHEFPAEILKYRELQKLKSTYIDPIIDYCVYYDNRIHTVFNQAVTTTGRLSSTEPNLQNIPIKSAYGKEFRKSFVPERNKVFISADYSQIDLRVLAHISQDTKFIEAFKAGADIHSATAREIFNIPERYPVPDSLRSAAKSINFGIIYGMSPFGLSKQLNIPFGKAKEYINGYFEKYNKIKFWMEQIVKKASEDGYVRTITGRIRYIPELRSTNAKVRKAGERMALNAPVQGSSADIIKIAMINVYNEIKLKGYKSLMLLQVHDDLLFEVPDGEFENMLSIIKNKMENPLHLSIPIVVDIKTGRNWGEMKKI